MLYCVYFYRYCTPIGCIGVYLTVCIQNIGPSAGAQGDIKSHHNYQPTFKEAQSGALLWAVDHLKEA